MIAGIKNFQIKTPEAASWLLLIAVIIEIIVASIGFYLGWLFVSEGSSLVKTPLSQKVVPALIFFVVAIIELTRVPFIISIYRSKFIAWKLFGSILLIFIMFIAFETMLVGFQRNIINSETDINFLSNQQSEIRQKIENIEIEIKENSEIKLETIQNNYDQETDKLNLDRNNKLNPYRNEIVRIDNEVAGAITDIQKEKLNSINLQLSDLDNQKENELTRAERNHQNLISNFENEKNTLNKRISDLNDQIASLKVGVFGGTGGKKKTFQDQITIAENKIGTFINEINKANQNFKSEITKINSSFEAKKISLNKEKEIEQNSMMIVQNQTKEDKISERLNYQDKIDKINIDFDSRELEAKEFFDQKIINLGFKEKIISNLRSEKNQYLDELNNLNSTINEKTSKNLVYNFAKNFGFVKACKGIVRNSDVSEECKSIVENWWFGSISAIIAIVGTALALASEVIRSSQRLSKKNKTLNNFNSLLVKIYRHVRRPKIKEVIKEKEIEKVVELIKEVPVQKIEYVEVPKIQEVIKKEIVHVPLYTNDENLLNIKKNYSSSTKKTKDE